MGSLKKIIVIQILEGCLLQSTPAALASSMKNKRKGLREIDEVQLHSRYPNRKRIVSCGSKLNSFGDQLEEEYER